MKEKGLVQITDTNMINSIVEKVIANNIKSVEQYKAGKTEVLGFLVGQVMKESQGKANPGMANKVLKEKLQ